MEMEHPVMFQGVAKDSPAFRLMTQMVRSSVLDISGGLGRTSEKREREARVERTIMWRSL